MTPNYSIGFALLITLIFAVVPTAGAEPTIAQHTTSQEIIYSVVISGGTVYDGLGTEGVRTDVGILGDRIAAIGDLSVARAARRIDATGLAVVPGFIDIHSHATSGSPESSGVVQRPLAENYVRQGVTTVMGGQDGSSPIQIGEFLAYLDAPATLINCYGSVWGLRLPLLLGFLSISLDLITDIVSGLLYLTDRNPNYVFSALIFGILVASDWVTLLLVYRASNNGLLPDDLPSWKWKIIPIFPVFELYSFAVAHSHC